jgi:hypothetical protein
VRAAGNASYWRRLNPSLTVGGRQDAGPRKKQVYATDGQALGARFREDGYLQLPPLLAPAQRTSMASAVSSLKDAGWPPVFAFVYDEFWAVWRLPSITALLRDRLGPSACMRARVWAYYVHPVRRARGWPPHAESYGARGVSVWIALTDATLDNGCMYVLPKDLVGGDVAIGDLFGRESISLETATRLLHCARALPAAAGSVLLWDFDVIHWGSVVQDASAPRISISAEFLPSIDDAAAGEHDLVRPLGAVPSFRDRLRIIAANIGFFAKNDTWTRRYEDLGQALGAALISR